MPNPNYWGPKPLLSMTSFKFYSSQPPMILALQGNDVDVIAQFMPAGATAILNNPQYKIIKLTSANHRELSMRNDIAPFTDPRVRQAVALHARPPGAVAALLSGDGTVANDYPFGPRFPSTDTSVPQRTQNIAMAKQLLAAAGHPNGFSHDARYRDLRGDPAAGAGDHSRTRPRPGSTSSSTSANQTLYYGKSTFGNSDWLDGTMSLVDYGDRGVPERLPGRPADDSTAPGTRPASTTRSTTRWSSSTWPRSTSRPRGRSRARSSGCCSQETPIVIPYWIDGLTASTPNVSGLNPTSIAQLYLNTAYKSA